MEEHIKFIACLNAFVELEIDIFRLDPSSHLVESFAMQIIDFLKYFRFAA